MRIAPLLSFDFRCYNNASISIFSSQVIYFKKMTPEEIQKKAQEEEINQILFKDFKQFADSTRLYFAKEYFALRVNVGSQGFTYVLTPYLAKLLSRVFAEQVKTFEGHFGEIKIDAPVASPLQMKDLDQPGDQGLGGDSDKPKPKKPKGKK